LFNSQYVISTLPEIILPPGRFSLAGAFRQSRPSGSLLSHQPPFIFIEKKEDIQWKFLAFFLSFVNGETIPLSLEELQSWSWPGLFC